MDTVELQAMTMEELRRDVQPVLAAAENYGRLFYVGDSEKAADALIVAESAAMLAVARARASAMKKWGACRNYPPCSPPFDRTNLTYPNYPCEWHAAVFAAEALVAELQEKGEQRDA